MIEFACCVSLVRLWMILVVFRTRRARRRHRQHHSRRMSASPCWTPSRCALPCRAARWCLCACVRVCLRVCVCVFTVCWRLRLMCDWLAGEVGRHECGVPEDHVQAHQLLERDGRRDPTVSSSPPVRIA
jgi:hypothetical protein